MKKIISIFLILSSFITLAEKPVCSDVIRAVNTDQEDMAVGTAVYKYEIEPKDILSIELTDYLSWKEKQIKCLANIRHTAVIHIEYIKEENQASQICELKAEINRFDNFLTFSSETVYSFSNKEETCRPETTLELSERVTCQSKPCQYSKVKLYRDYKDNCSCKTIWDFPVFTDHSQDYLDFYNPAKFFKKD